MTYVFSIFARTLNTVSQPHALSFNVKYDTLIAEMKRIFGAIQKENGFKPFKLFGF